MARKLQEYESGDIRVTFEPALCIHAARCVMGLPAVFKPRERPWVLPDAAPADQIAAVVQRCPSGALQFERLDGGPAEAPDVPATISPQPDGPLHVRGDFELRAAGTDEVRHMTRASLCRCGASNNKPFCDNSHREIGFRAP